MEQVFLMDRYQIGKDFWVDIGYPDGGLRRACEERKAGNKAYGEQIAGGVRKRVAQIRAAETVSDLIAGLGKWHWMGADWPDCLSGSVTKNWRIIVRPIGVEGKDATAVSVEIIAVEDYH